MLKRTFDIILSFIGIIILLPILLVIAVLVKLTSKGPVFFTQTRVGRNGVDFKLYKFRSMTVLDEASKGRFDAGDTSRITTIGKFIRKTKLDELPQLWNVVCGDMSLVGPRPEIRQWVERYKERWQKILTARPGITDPASIVFRNEEEVLSQSNEPLLHYEKIILPQKLKLYEQYVNHQSLHYDLFLIFKTIIFIFVK
ncbi:MAG: sugar transferase [Planctomycetaceae bacterium]|jgi:lipopolysaccharide/colanic/teichoic acid biosynthesis glycosyltransferase|nr:sugar transferase [Planctomycetaceae bacterium]